MREPDNAGPIQNLFRRFIQLTQDELFDSCEQIEDRIADENCPLFKSLLDETFGYNLLLDTQGEALLKFSQELIECAFENLIVFFESHDSCLTTEEKSYLDSLREVLKAKRSNIFSHRDPISVRSEFDLRRVYSHPQEPPVRTQSTNEFLFDFKPRTRALIDDQLRLYTTSREGLGKIIARSPIKDFQRELI